MIAYLGAGCFGAIVGWYVYYINRYRRSDVQIGDLTTILGVIGGGVVTVLFSDKDLFGAYGIGLAVGFFGYFLALIFMVGSSPNFTADWFLDGRRKRPEEPFYLPGEAPPPQPGFDLGPGGGPEAAAPVAPAPAAIVLPNIVAAALDPNASRVITLCEDDWPATSGDCSAFVRDVAADLGIPLNGNADAIVDRIRTADWKPVADGRAAKVAADAGQFVVGGLKGNEQAEPSAHGHVVVVTSGPLARGLYPTAYWGRLGGVGERGKTVNWAWRAGDRDKVTYAAKDL